MPVTRLLLACFAFFALGAFGQPAARRPEFEVATVKAASPSLPQRMDAGLHIDGAQVHISSLSLKDYVRIAYGVPIEQVSCPEWMASERFDVSAKIPEGGSSHITEMLQSLLEDRLAVKVHREKREYAVYALTTLPGGARPKASAEQSVAPPREINAGGSGSSNGVSLVLGDGGVFSLANDKIEARRISMEAFAQVLARFLDRQVIDATGLQGQYDFSANLTPEDYRAMLIQSAVNSGVTLPGEALRLLQNPNGGSLEAGLRAVGLKLEPRKAPLEVVVVDSANKTPVAN
jgi:uncharacterized protein (TIGR03435 family)